MFFTPTQIYNQLNRYVVGQEDAKKAVTAALFLHVSKTVYTAKQALSGYGEVKLKTSNCLIMGPSGCGKTFLCETAASVTRLPYLEISARSLSQEGYKGNSITDYFQKWYMDLDKKEKEQSPNAVVFIDEVDKICQGDSEGWATGLQHTLLKVIEGTRLYFGEGKGHIDTHSMLFFFGGNFASIRTKVRQVKHMGFNEPPAPKEHQLHNELMRAGMLQEIAGRISIVSEVRQLTRPELRKALLHSSGSILAQYVDLYKDIYGKKLELSRRQIDKILDVCMAKEIGARGLQSALDEYIVENIHKECIDLVRLKDEFQYLYQ